MLGVLICVFKTADLTRIPTSLKMVTGLKMNTHLRMGQSLDVKTSLRAAGCHDYHHMEVFGRTKLSIRGKKKGRRVLKTSEPH